MPAASRKALFADATSPARTSASPSGEQELAARLLVQRLRELERFQRHPVEPRGLLVGEQRERAISGAPGVAEAPVEVPSGDRVVRELGQVGSGLVAVERLERLDRQPVQPDAAGGSEPFVERVADEDVREAKATRPVGNVGDDAGGQRLVEQCRAARPLRHPPCERARRGRTRGRSRMRAPASGRTPPRGGRAGGRLRRGCSAGWRAGPRRRTRKGRPRRTGGARSRRRRADSPRSPRAAQPPAPTRRSPTPSARRIARLRARSARQARGGGSPAPGRPRPASRSEVVRGWGRHPGRRRGAGCGSSRARGRGTAAAEARAHRPRAGRPGRARAADPRRRSGGTRR